MEESGSANLGPRDHDRLDRIEVSIQGLILVAHEQQKTIQAMLDLVKESRAEIQDLIILQKEQRIDFQQYFEKHSS